MLDNLKYAYIRSNDGTLNFDLISAAWSGLCSSTNYIYYKTPEQLCLYNNIIEDRKKYRDSVAYNLHSSRSIRSAAQSKYRYNITIPPKKYRRLGPIYDDSIIATPITTGSITRERVLPINIAPKAITSTSSIAATSTTIVTTSLDTNLNSSFSAVSTTQEDTPKKK